MPLEPAETRPRSKLPESRVAFPRYNQLSWTLTKRFYGCHRLLWRNRSSTTRSHTCQRHGEITQSHTFAALIRLSTTTHNPLTFNTSEISSNNSEKLSLFTYTRLIQVPGCSAIWTVDQLLDPVFIPELAQVKVRMQFCSDLIHLTPKSLFPRPKT